MKREAVLVSHRPGGYREKSMAPRSRILLLFAAAIGLGIVPPAFGQKQAPDAGKKIPRGRLLEPQIKLGAQQMLAGRNFSLAEDPLDLQAVRAAAVPSEVRELVMALASDDFGDRVEAMLSLRTHPAPDHCLMAVLDEGGLLEEQRLRLLGTIEWRIINRPRGAVGIRMLPRNPGVEPAGIEVQEIIAGLPAERVLRVGDLLVRLDGRKVEVNQDLILHVQQMRPGEKIGVELLRPVNVPPDEEEAIGLVQGDRGRWYEPIEVELSLGSYDQLGENRGMLNAETNRRDLYVERVRGEWGEPRSRRTLRPPASNTVKPRSNRMLGP